MIIIVFIIFIKIIQHRLTDLYVRFFSFLSMFINAVTAKGTFFYSIKLYLCPQTTYQNR